MGLSIHTPQLSDNLTTTVQTTIRRWFTLTFTNENGATNRTKLVVTVSLGLVGLGIAANFYLRLLELKRRNSSKDLQRRSIDNNNNNGAADNTRSEINNNNSSTKENSKGKDNNNLVEMIPELKSAFVRIKDLQHVNRVLAQVIQSGSKRLQVVSDFDRTISLCSYNGVPCPTSNAVLEQSQFVSVELRAKFTALREHYLAIEHDPALTKAQKLPHMIEWWTKSFALVKETGVHRDDLLEIVRQSATHLKQGCEWFFYTLERCDVPLLVFSAGLGNIIQEWLLQSCGSFKNMKIVSNFMTFDKELGVVSGFEGSTLIHIFNKNEGVLLGTDYEQCIANRPNVILLGDSLGDVDMAAGFPSLNNILKIGFLNGDKWEVMLPKYMEVYDIVMINDDTFNVPNAILRSII